MIAVEVRSDLIEPGLDGLPALAPDRFSGGVPLSGICEQCRENKATTRMPWWTSLASIFLPEIGAREKLCKDCAGGRKFLALLVLAAAAFIVFVLAVIVW
jgi:hypothetical protein